jgi:hypothetical protein
MSQKPSASSLRHLTKRTQKFCLSSLYWALGLTLLLLVACSDQTDQTLPTEPTVTWVNEEPDTEEQQRHFFSQMSFRLDPGLSAQNSLITGLQKNQAEIGDLLRISVYQEEDLSNLYQIDSAGKISFPLIGDVLVSGLTLEQIDQTLTQKLLDGYLVKPNVSVEIVERRSFVDPFQTEDRL